MTAPTPVRLREYAPPGYLVEDVHLTFRLDPTATRVTSRIRFVPNPAADERPAFRLDGEALKTISIRVDGVPVEPCIDANTLTLDAPRAPFLFEAEVEIDPSANTVLEGLYISNGMFCTQCEAEGFRRITWYPDRPDVMAPFSVRIESDLPVLLSNGDPIGSGDGWAEWHDPWPKPSYLFALVAGDLMASRDRFTTSENREVELAVWTRPGDETKTAYAIDALKRAMRWDEVVYGRAYDLGQFNIVAVDDFNAGAMENKGLNIFNSHYVLARPDIATDRDYELIEGIVAHEYFHNWTGNRITCRDWFQLCLKEGLTVFRDQQFSGDMRSHAVKRIDDVITLRAAQFPEDNGPLAHPVRPESYIEINNFYTATVYEKGAEVIRMLRTFVGDKAYDAALDLYFRRHDGEACTIEDWLRVFEDTTGRDLSQWMRWYQQSGTPRLSVSENFEDGTYSLTLTQETPPTPGQPDKAPLVLPVAVGLVGTDGAEMMPTRIVTLSETSTTFRIDGLPAKPVASINRNFSVPVILQHDMPQDERQLLFAHDTDPFNRWEAGRQLIKSALVRKVTKGDLTPDALLDALDRLAADDDLDPAFRAFALSLPTEDDTAQSLFDAGHVPDPTAIYEAHEAFRNEVATRLQGTAAGLYESMEVPGPFSPDAAAAGRRALRLKALSFLTRVDGPGRAEALSETADNMTERLGALSALLAVGHGEDEVAAFYEAWKDERLVMDKWFALRIGGATPDRAVGLARELAAHPAFEWSNPNRFRALVKTFARSPAAFHHPSGAGYRFVTDWLIRLDPRNPSTAARTATVFETWRRFDADRQQMIEAELGRLVDRDDVSRDMQEIVERLRAG